MAAPFDVSAFGMGVRVWQMSSARGQHVPIKERKQPVIALDDTVMFTQQGQGRLVNEGGDWYHRDKLLWFRVRDVFFYSDQELSSCQHIRTLFVCRLEPTLV